MSLVRRIGHVVKSKIKRKKNKHISCKLRYRENFPKLDKNSKRNPQIIVSLTSYSKRFSTLDICLKSLLNQTMLPDKIILYLSQNESISDVPESVKKLKKNGLEIRFVDMDLKPHKKYYYAMKEFPDDIIITVDDDVIYSKSLVEELYKTYKKFPYCVVAARAHKIKFQGNRIKKYREWEMNVNENVPSFLLMPTGVGGILYPPHLMSKILFDINWIKKYINVDDLWLKNVEVRSNIPVVMCNPKVDYKRIEIESAQDIGLSQQNYFNNENDIYLNRLNLDFNFDNQVIKAEKKLKDIML